MMRTLIAMISFLVTVPCCHAACEAPVAGLTIRWAAAVCGARNETDDYDAPHVTACTNALLLSNKMTSSRLEVCSLNKKYKLELCKNAAKFGAEESVQVCMRSNASIPRVVSNGIGG
jgi:hypothetical protein